MINGVVVRRVGLGGVYRKNREVVVGRCVVGEPRPRRVCFGMSTHVRHLVPEICQVQNLMILPKQVILILIYCFGKGC